MEKYIKCERCKKKLHESYFWNKKIIKFDNDSLDAFGCPKRIISYEKYPICKRCLTYNITIFNEESFLSILHKLNFPFIPYYFYGYAIKDSLNPQKYIGKYMARMRLKSFNDWTWNDSVEIFDRKLNKIEREDEFYIK